MLVYMKDAVQGDVQRFSAWRCGGFLVLKVIRGTNAETWTNVS